MKYQAQVEHAIRAAQRAGVPATLIVLGTDDGVELDVPDDLVEDQAYAEGAVAKAADEQSSEKHVDPEPLWNEIEDLKKKLIASEKRANEAASNAVPPDNQVLQHRIAELEGELAATKDMAAQAPPTGDKDQVIDMAPLASFDEYPVANLGLTQKTQKGVDRCGCKTVADVRVAFLEGKLQSKEKDGGKLPKDSVIEVADKLLGRAPSIDGVIATTPTDAVPAAGLPAGHEDRPWTERLQAAFRKEIRAGEVRQAITQLTTEITRLRGQQITPEVEQQLASAQAELQKQEKRLAMFDGQVVASLWSCNLPHDLKTHRTVNNALRAAGLPHLMNEPPQPVSE